MPSANPGACGAPRRTYDSRAVSEITRSMIEQETYVHLTSLLNGKSIGNLRNAQAAFHGPDPKRNAGVRGCLSRVYLLFV